jgi:hypothetical protein
MSRIRALEEETALRANGTPRPINSTENAVRAVRDRRQGSRLGLKQTAARLGHGRLELHSTLTRCGARYFAECGCGWMSTTRATPGDVLGAVCHHLHLVIRKWDLSGQPLPDLPATASNEPSSVDDKIVY